MAITIRQCIVCRNEMQCIRANKLICSNVCHSKMHKLRVKLNLTTSQMIEKLKAELLYVQ